MTGPVDMVITPRTRDLGGFEVARVLPHAKRRMVGPFIFFDRMGPNMFDPGQGIDVRPHPHIGLATVTYLYDGEIVHRDSLGVEQPIRPGDVNWMTAGRGISHSERTGTDLRGTGSNLSGIQSWIALPKSEEEIEPAFTHHPAASLPEFTLDGAAMRVVAGTAYGHKAPVDVYSGTFYVDVAAPAGTRFVVSDEHEERAVFVADGRVEIDGQTYEARQMAILAPGGEVPVRALDDSRIMLLGGAAMDGERHIWWNFVSSSKDRIERAKADWREGRFARVPGDDEFIPLPEE